MSRNGSGTYTAPSGAWNPATNGNSATAADWNALLADLAAAMTQSISADGQTAITGNLNMGNNKLSSLAAGNASGQSLAWQQLFSQGTESDLASATTTDIGAQNTNFLRITGTTTITSFGANYNGPRFLRFSGVLTLTHNASTLILPNGVNITTEAGTTLIALPISGGWYVSAYAPPAIPVLRSYLAGLTLSTAGSSTTMTIAAGVATDSTNAVSIVLPAAISKTTASWAVGTGNGGLDTGSIANNTTYHCHLIRRPDTGVVDVLFSLSATAPTLPTNYTQFRHIMSWMTNGSVQWQNWVQIGDRVEFKTPVLDVSATNPGILFVNRTLSTPVGIRTEAMLNVFITEGAVRTSGYLSSLDTDDLAASATAAPLSSLATSAVGSGAGAVTMRVYTNTASQIRSRLAASDATTVLRIATLGFIWTRGRDA